MQINIKGKIVNLRKISKYDAESMRKNADCAEISKYTNIPYPYRLKDAFNFIKDTQQKMRSGKAYNLGIELQDGKNIIGMISMMNIDRQNKNAEIGYWLGKRYWGRKIMKEAVKLVTNFGFKKLKLVRIYANVVPQNIASVKLLEKSGFKYEGRLRKAVYRNGKWMDYLLYSILKR